MWRAGLDWQKMRAETGQSVVWLMWWVMPWGHTHRIERLSVSPFTPASTSGYLSFCVPISYQPLSCHCCSVCGTHLQTHVHRRAWHSVLGNVAFYCRLIIRREVCDPVTVWENDPKKPDRGTDPQPWGHKSVCAEERCVLVCVCVHPHLLMDGKQYVR